MVLEEEEYEDPDEELHCIVHLWTLEPTTAALDWACGPGKVDCSPGLRGQSCYEPDNVVAHADYAFDAHYHQMGMAAGTCYFNGVATITTTDPIAPKDPSNGSVQLRSESYSRPNFVCGGVKGLGLQASGQQIASRAVGSDALATTFTPRNAVEATSTSISTTLPSTVENQPNLLAFGTHFDINRAGVLV
ncbi:hypothetical protein Cgig2_031751 [Carnegiea gigantea]|uniref:X8 domain-containing protein n=1 Tax=Carnegiea gigantea TaxID=171969 RepID=A0A9Q1KQS9_9CARY|nr:hypothetical protein Cgig2_031751 [Carnegiea gigantea]